ncbi:MAG: hypothetical protein ABSG95_13825 [Solirubrobacteraceae bacterium]
MSTPPGVIQAEARAGPLSGAAFALTSASSADGARASACTIPV